MVAPMLAARLGMKPGDPVRFLALLHHVAVGAAAAAGQTAPQGWPRMNRTQDEFVAARQPAWDELDALLARKRVLHKLPPVSIARAAALYRDICSDLMRARGRRLFGGRGGRARFGLAARACAALYSAPPYRLAALWELVAAGFPQAVRRNARFVALAAALFVLPGLLGFAGASRSRAFAIQIMSESMVEQMEKSYGDLGHGRGDGTDAMMASFYVYNNVGIAFRCFATGILFGLGSIFFLVYNGLVIGVVAGRGGRRRTRPQSLHLRHRARRLRAHRHRDLRRGGHRHGLRPGRTPGRARGGPRCGPRRATCSA